MSANSRFAVSVHMLAYLAYKQGDAVSSSEIASSVNTHPVVIRRLLTALTRARLVSAQKGAAGGFSLARTAENISLLAIYRAVEPGSSFGRASVAPCPKCPVGSKIQSALDKVLAKAQSSLEAELARVSIADVRRDLGPLCNSTQC